jgi:peptidoglycan/LPS O-acetylase OafA/YrhL
MNTSPQLKDFPALTGIRAVAAYMVFIHHCNIFSARYFGKAVHLFFSEFHVGVTMFFVLSGLLLYLRYCDMNFRKPASIYNYFVNRFARIYPLYFAILVLSIIVYSSSGYFNAVSHKTELFYFITAFTLTRGFFADSYHFFVAQSWSLTVEECFYMLCPVFFLLIKKWRPSLILLPIAFISTGCLIVFFAGGTDDFGFLRDYRFLFNFTFFGRCIEFFSGIALGILYKKWNLPVKKSGKCTLAGMVAMIACIAGLSLLHTDTQYGDYHPVGIVINNMILPIAGISVLYWGLLTERNIINSILASPLFVLLGRASYAFYLIHVGIFAEWFIKNVSENPGLLFLYLNVVSILLYKFLEHPVNALIKKHFRISTRLTSQQS